MNKDQQLKYLDELYAKIERNEASILEYDYDVGYNGLATVSLRIQNGAAGMVSPQVVPLPTQAPAHSHTINSNVYSVSTSPYVANWSTGTVITDDSITTNGTITVGGSTVVTEKDLEALKSEIVEQIQDAFKEQK